jgi:hypothetical protein
MRNAVPIGNPLAAVHARHSARSWVCGEASALKPDTRNACIHRISSAARKDNGLKQAFYGD